MNEILEDIQAAELDLGQDLARYPDLRFALGYWTRKRGARFAPSRGDIDPAEIPSILPRVMLADVVRDNTGRVDFRFRLSGTGICDVHGYNLTTLRPSELSPEPYGRLIDAHYREAVGRRSPMAHILVLNTNRKSRSYARLILPLSADGETVDMLMMVDSETQNSLQEFLEMIEVIGRRG